jgi:hypothetical protein
LQDLFHSRRFIVAGTRADEVRRLEKDLRFIGLHGCG